MTLSNDTIFFGYGTTMYSKWRPEDLSSFEPAKLEGFQRVWAHRDRQYQSTDLTIIPVKGTSIFGVAMLMNNAETHMLNKREDDYYELAVRLGGGEEAYAFLSDNRFRKMPSEDYPVMLSDLLGVVLGYYELNKMDGVQHLIDTTMSWEFPVYNDSFDDDSYTQSLDFVLAKRVANKFKVLRKLVEEARFDLKV